MAASIDSKMTNASSVGLLREVQPTSKANESQKSQGPSFADALSAQTAKIDVKAPELQKSAQKPILKFSNHALDRMNMRGIHFSPEQITKIEQGMQKASEKGAKESLVLTDDSALIVSLKNNTVVTVMDKSMLKENVFTNIDSTVFV